MAANMRIPDETVAAIKEANDIVSVVQQYVDLPKKSADNLFGLCPFHAEKTPSFSVSPSKQIYYCFGCHKGGDVVSFIKEIEHLDYPEALRFLARRANIEVPEVDDKRYREARERRKALERVMLEAARYYYRALFSPQGRAASRYLSKRGISPETAKRFGLGYASAEWEGLYKYLLAKGCEQDVLLESGLFKQSRHGNYYDLFRERLIFPILSPLGRGRVLAFGGRVLDDSLPKYINSPETPLFVKGENLYALDQAKKTQEKRFLLVEGYLDVISLHQGGFKQAVAPLGTALTTQQAKLLAQFKTGVTVGFDADNAGQNAIMRSLAFLEARGLDINILRIPDGKDPDEFIRTHGAEAFADLLQQCESVFDFRLRRAEQIANADGALNPQIFLRELLGFLPDIQNETIKELYLARAATILGVSIDSLQRDVRRASSSTDARRRGHLTPRDNAASRGHDGTNRSDWHDSETAPTEAPVEWDGKISGGESGATAPVLPPKNGIFYRATLRLLLLLAANEGDGAALSQEIEEEDLQALQSSTLRKELLKRLKSGDLNTATLFSTVELAEGERMLAADLAAEQMALEALFKDERHRSSVLGKTEDPLAVEIKRAYGVLRLAVLKRRRQRLYAQLASLVEGADAEKKKNCLRALDETQQEIERMRGQAED